MRVSIEGMWAIYFGDVASGNPIENSGIIVLETGRVFGGDSFVAYLGHYQLDGDHMTATARNWSYNPAHAIVTTAFGRSGQINVEIEFAGKFEPEMGAHGRIMGHVWEKGNPAAKLPALLHRISDLP